jgi:predicted cobalt transporter CbtA
VLRKVVLWTLAGLVMFAIAGFLILPPILKSILTGKLS